MDEVHNDSTSSKPHAPIHGSIWGMGVLNSPIISVAIGCFIVGCLIYSKHPQRKAPRTPIAHILFLGLTMKIAVQIGLSPETVGTRTVQSGGIPGFSCFYPHKTFWIDFSTLLTFTVYMAYSAYKAAIDDYFGLPVEDQTASSQGVTSPHMHIYKYVLKGGILVALILSAVFTREAAALLFANYIGKPGYWAVVERRNALWRVVSACYFAAIGSKLLSTVVGWAYMLFGERGPVTKAGEEVTDIPKM